MARSIMFLRAKASPRAISALTRSALTVFSLSIKAPQTSMLLSYSCDAAAATHGAGSTWGSLAGSAPVARACEAASAHRRHAAAPRLPDQLRIKCRAKDLMKDRNKRDRVLTVAILQHFRTLILG